MGLAIGWIAFETDSKRAVFDELGLEETENPPEFYPSDFGRFTGVDLGNGWLAIVFYGGLANWTEPFEDLSAKRRIVCCDIYERQNLSQASLWADGKCIWEIEHFPEKGGQDYDPEHLEIKGSLPTELASICERFRIEQKTADYDHIGDAPIKVAEQITGFDVTLDRSKWRQMDLIPAEGGPMWLANEQSKKGCRQLIFITVAIALALVGIIGWWMFR